MNFIFMVTIILAINAERRVVLGEHCDKYGILLYEDLGCVPKNDNLEECPVKYECQGLKDWINECHFRGKIYSDKEIVENKESALSCDVACFCDTYGPKSRFICAVLDCPEWLGNPASKGCYRRHSLDACCSVEQICLSSDKIAKCVVDGVEYKEGERFVPKNSCLECVCQKGYSDVLEAPFCRRKVCGEQLKNAMEIQNNCAPVYRKLDANDVMCCPDYWICPNGNEIIEGEKKSGNFCKFGSIFLTVGQSFQSVDQTVKCECILPPLVACVLQKNL